VLTPKVNTIPSSSFYHIIYIASGGFVREVQQKKRKKRNIIKLIKETSNSNSKTRNNE
jgi:hypothetical protein